MTHRCITETSALLQLECQNAPCSLGCYVMMQSCNALTHNITF